MQTTKSLFLFVVAVSCFLMSSTQASSQATDSILHENGYLYYHEYGKGSPVILLSGGPGNRCQQIEEVAIHLGKSYRCILFEQRGTGLSIPAPMDSTTINFKAALDDLNRLLDHLKLTEATFVGHSWGGTLSMSFAAYYPKRVSSLILIAPGFFDADKELRKTFELNGLAHLGELERKRFDSLLQKQVKSPLSGEELEELRTLMYKSYLFDKVNAELILPKIRLGTRNQLMNQLIWKDLDRIGFNVIPKLQQYPRPVTIITGRQDPLAFVTYEIHKRLPKANVNWLQECGHYPMYEQPESFYPALLQAIRTGN